MTYLLTCNGRIMHENLRGLVKRLLLIIETNAITSLVAVLSIIMLYAFPGTTYFTTSTLLLPTLYANSFAMTLNSRLTFSHSQQVEEDPSLTNLRSPQIDSDTPHVSRFRARSAEVLEIRSFPSDDVDIENSPAMATDPESTPPHHHIVDDLSVRGDRER
ncbi:hypothetical protein PM082_001955 [Marasmius tenuissimus]|nr:hypothetical protein PM082_001955 [Marasmius tenuissimus]